MIKAFLTYLTISSLLLMNIQAAVADMGEIFHHDSNSKIVQSNDIADTHNHSEDESHCQHCCHGHVSNIVSHESFNCDYRMLDNSFPLRINNTSSILTPLIKPPVFLA